MIRKHIFLASDPLAGALVTALDELVATSERVAELRRVGYDEGDLLSGAVARVNEAWEALRVYAAERYSAGGSVVAVAVPDPGDVVFR